MPSDAVARCVIRLGPEGPHTMCTASSPGGAALSPRVAWPGGLCQGYTGIVDFPPGGLLTKFGVPKYCRYIGRGRLWLNSIKDAASSSRIPFFARGLRPVSMFSFFWHLVPRHSVLHVQACCQLSVWLKHETIEPVGQHRVAFAAIADFRVSMSESHCEPSENSSWTFSN